MRLKSDLFTLLDHAVAGKLDQVEASWDRRVALGVVLAAANYPGTPRTGDVISGLPKVSEYSEYSEDSEDSHIFPRRERRERPMVRRSPRWPRTLRHGARRQRQANAETRLRPDCREFTSTGSAISPRHRPPAPYRDEQCSKAGRLRPAKACDDRHGTPEELLHRPADAHCRGARRYRGHSWASIPCRCLAKAEGEPLAGHGCTSIIEAGRVFERGGVAFSQVSGSALPASATASARTGRSRF